MDSKSILLHGGILKIWHSKGSSYPQKIGKYSSNPFLALMGCEAVARGRSPEVIGVIWDTWGEVTQPRDRHPGTAPHASQAPEQIKTPSPQGFCPLKLRLSNTFLLEPFGFSNIPYKGPTDESRINQQCQWRDRQEQRGHLSWSPVHKQVQWHSPCPGLGFPASPWGASPQGSFQEHLLSLKKVPTCWVQCLKLQYLVWITVPDSLK